VEMLSAVNQRVLRNRGAKQVTAYVPDSKDTNVIIGPVGRVARCLSDVADDLGNHSSHIIVIDHVGVQYIVQPPGGLPVVEMGNSDETSGRDELYRPCCSQVPRDTDFVVEAIQRYNGLVARSYVLARARVQ
jgi:hypothetical protein